MSSRKKSTTEGISASIKSHDDTSLERLLRRPDIWRGESSHFTQQEVCDTGFIELNQALLHRGWPTGCLIEICQRFYACEWWLFSHAIKKRLCDTSTQFMALLNPPLLPFKAGLEQLGIPSNKIVIINTKTPQDLISSFTELNQSDAFSLVFAWQQKNALHYNQLRKVQLSVLDKKGVYVLFRHVNAQSHSSPARLRLVVKPSQKNIHVNIFKQRGRLHGINVDLPIPLSWQSLPPHEHLLKEQNMLFYKTARTAQISVFPKIRILKKSESSYEYH